MRTALVAALLALATPAAAAPSADLWDRWTAHSPGSDLTVEHTPWAGILSTRITPGPDGVARFDYAAVSPQERATLDAYLAALAATPVDDLDRPEQMAYWINLYNALTVWVVLRDYPIDSILDIKTSPGFFAFGPWDEKLVDVARERLSLNDIEHRILRPIWRDPRIHYAVNCASIGCPDLGSEPYRAADLDRQLDAAARVYVNHPRGVERVGSELIVSSIYQWFKEDFGGNDRGVLEHLRRYAEAPLAAVLEGHSRLDGHHYDWALNEPRR